MILGNDKLVFDAWGRPKSVQDYSILSGLFTFDVPDALWKVNENGVELMSTNLATKAVSSLGALVVTSGATNGDTTIVQSKRHPRYQPNRGHLYSSSMIIPNPTQGVVDFGLFTPENGVFFRVKEGKLYIVRKSNGVEVVEEEAELDTDKNGKTNVFLDKGNIYDIQFQWRGVGSYYFFVNQQEVGHMKVLGTLDELSIANPALSIGFKCTNDGTGEASLKCGCVDVSSEGGVQQRQIARSIVSPSGTFSNEVIAAFRVNNTFNGMYNTRDVAPLRLQTDVSKKCLVNAYITRDPSALTLLGGTAWTDIDNGHMSTLLPSASSTITFDANKATKYATLPSVSTAVNYLVNPNRDKVDFFMTNGDIIILEVEGSAVAMQSVMEFGVEV